MYYNPLSKRGSVHQGHKVISGFPRSPDDAVMVGELVTALCLPPWPPDFEYKQTTGLEVYCLG